MNELAGSETGKGQAEKAVADSTYTVNGMTCEHCDRAVTEAIRAIPGVSAVRVDLASNQVHVRSERPLDSVAVRAAVADAGYELVSA
jgi:copper chaperone